MITKGFEVSEFSKMQYFSVQPEGHVLCWFPSKL